MKQYSVFLFSQDGEAATEEVKKSNHVLRKLEKQKQNQVLDPHIEEKFGGGRLLACISSRPGQCGCADRYATFYSICYQRYIRCMLFCIQ